MKKTLLFIVSYIILYVAFAPVNAYASDNIKEGINLYNSGEYELAIKFFSKEILEYPNNSKAYNRRGLCYYNIGQYENAIENFNKAIILKPENFGDYMNRGNSYDFLGKKELAINDYNKAVSLNPNSALAYYNRSIAYFNIGKHKKAIIDFEKAVDIKPDIGESCNSFNSQIELLKEAINSKKEHSSNSTILNLNNSIIGSWQFENHQTGYITKLNFNTNGIFSGFIKNDKAVLIDYEGTWKVEDSTIFYIYTKSSDNRIPVGKKDKDFVFDITKDYFIIHTMSGTIKKYQRHESL